MKVISIRQPWASLIVEGYKEFEFRNWKTKYRGEILIHASLAVEKDNMKAFSKLNLECPTGVIIGKAVLVDCIEVSEKFESNLIKSNNLVYGRSKGRGGFAWKLSSAEKIETIQATGQLGLWNYYTSNEIMKLMENIEYGWIDKYYNCYYEIDETFSEKYILQSPSEVTNNKLGLCWDQVELERYYFKNSGYNINTFFICHYDNNICPSHTFLVYYLNNNYYWFEHSWKKFRGIHKYSYLKDLLLDVKSKFIEYELNNKYNSDNLLLREYKRPKYKLSAIEFYKHCKKEDPINLNNI